MNFNEVRKAYYSLFRDDATLNGSTMLNKVGIEKKVWNGLRGARQTTPSLTVNQFPVNNNVHTDVHNGQLIINCYTAKLDGGEVDVNRQGLINERVEFLVNEDQTGLPERAGYLIYHSHVLTRDLGQLDPKHPDEHFGWVRIAFLTRINP